MWDPTGTSPPGSRMYTLKVHIMQLLIAMATTRTDKLAVQAFDRDGNTLKGSGSLTSPCITLPHLTSPRLTSPHLTSPHITSPRLASHHLTSHHLTLPHLMLPHLTSHHLASSCLVSHCTTLGYLSTDAPHNWPQTHGISQFGFNQFCSALLFGALSHPMQCIMLHPQSHGRVGRGLDGFWGRVVNFSPKLGWHSAGASNVNSRHLTIIHHAPHLTTVHHHAM